MLGVSGASLPVTVHDAMSLIRAKTVDEIDRLLSGPNGPDDKQRQRFFRLLGATLDSDRIARSYTAEDHLKIQQLALRHAQDTQDDQLLDEVLSTHPCNARSGLSSGDCKTEIDGRAYAAFARSSAGNACWETLKFAQRKEKAFNDGIRKYYAFQGAGKADALSLCDEPAEPARCKLGWCTKLCRMGVSFSPLADLGVALPIGTPSFGFARSKMGESKTASLQATVGIMARAFAFQGKLDVRAGVGIANARNADDSAAAALAWTAQLGLFGVMGAGFLWLTDPGNGDTGTALMFSIDLASVRDLVGETSSH